jgi:hypothetical protein
MQKAVLANQTLADVGRSCAPRARRKNVPKVTTLHKLKSIFERLSYRRLCDSAHFSAFWQQLMQRQVVVLKPWTVRQCFKKPPQPPYRVQHWLWMV